MTCDNFLSNGLLMLALIRLARMKSVFDCLLCNTAHTHRFPSRLRIDHFLQKTHTKILIYAGMFISNHMNNHIHACVFISGHSFTFPKAHNPKGNHNDTCTWFDS